MDDHPSEKHGRQLFHACLFLEFQDQANQVLFALFYFLEGYVVPD
jgi:hypothetical protein